MAKIKGFAEWSPQQQIFQSEIIQTIKKSFELYGFVPLITRSIEPLEELLAQGDTDKEIYGVHRLVDLEEAEFEWGLHYDLTVPFARYVSENTSKITLPYRRYQIQPCWRGERPQLGRFREFIQADADIVDEGILDLRYDAELVALFNDLLLSLPIPECRLLINNRKLLEGFYENLGISDVFGVLRSIDKLAKLGSNGVKEELTSKGLNEKQADECINLSQIQATSGEQLKLMLEDLGITNKLFNQGVDELCEVLDKANSISESNSVVAALHIARGFGYYTGTVAETEFVDYPEFGSICSGGRYDNLVKGSEISGMGLSIGVSRLLSYCFSSNWVSPEASSVAEVMVIVNNQEQRSLSDQVARNLRARGIKSIVSDKESAFKKQIKYAEKLGINYVWFPSEDDNDEVKNLKTRQQYIADSNIWKPNNEI